MARITAYESSDGKLFRDRKSYRQHEANLIAAEKLKALFVAGYQAIELPEGADLASSTYKLLVEHIGLDTVREILNTPFKPTDNSDGPENDNDTSGGNTESNSTVVSDNAQGDVAALATAPSVTGHNDYASDDSGPDYDL